MNSVDEGAELRRDVRRIGELLGQTLVRQEGNHLLELVESVRRAVKENKEQEVLDQITDEQRVQLVRAFSTYFNLANVVEQRHRSKLLKDKNQSTWTSRAVDRIIEAQKTRPELSK